MSTVFDPNTIRLFSPERKVTSYADVFRPQQSPQVGAESEAKVSHDENLEAAIINARNRRTDLAVDFVAGFFLLFIIGTCIVVTGTIVFWVVCQLAQFDMSEIANGLSGTRIH